MIFRDDEDVCLPKACILQDNKTEGYSNKVQFHFTCCWVILRMMAQGVERAAQVGGKRPS